MWITQKVTQINGMSKVNEKLISITKLKIEYFEDLEGLNTFNNKIEINNLIFSYQEGNNILNGINYTFEKNKKYAIVGESGCGKSTLIKLILGYYREYEGNITIDSKEVKNIKFKSISQLISMIHQNVYMFDKSIKDNILLGEKYSKNQVESTIELSGINKFIDMLPNGIDSLIGENGCNISGGQK